MIKRVVLSLLALTLIVVIGGAILTVYTPYPTSLLIRKVFEGGMAIKPSNYDEISNRVNVVENVDYESQHKEGTMDIFSPKTGKEKLPVIIWVHGGAFVGGDKDDVDEYATQIADRGYHVVSMNYHRAPGSVYPTQINQISEVYTYLEKIQENYKLDLDRIFLAGDSAGAHMVAQFAMIQTDPSYADKMKIGAVIDPSTIMGTLLLCGPYDLMKFSNFSEESKILGFFMERVAWAYLGKNSWASDSSFDHLSVTNHVSANYPSSFIMDGTVNTFTDHGKELSVKLQDLGVIVESVFYDEPGLELQHEYQFQMDNEYSVNTFNKMVQFLDTHSK